MNTQDIAEIAYETCAHVYGGVWFGSLTGKAQLIDRAQHFLAGEPPETVIPGFEFLPDDQKRNIRLFHKVVILLSEA